MGLLDDAKQKAEDLKKSNPDKVEGVSDQALDKGAGLADKVTGGKYDDQVDSAKSKADDAI